MANKESEYFEYYNPNPIFKPTKSRKRICWGKLDCTIRAICATIGMNWMDAYKFASDSAFKAFEPFTGPDGFHQVMTDLGFHKVCYMRAKKRETVEMFCQNHPNETAILKLERHVVAVKNGKFFDTWDCSQKTVYYYYVK